VKFLPWMAWISFWSMLMHLALAITNSCSLIRLVTRFRCKGPLRKAVVSPIRR
jgi:hypothetical protein